MANVLLGVTGSVAAIYTRELFDDLRAAGHDVKVVATAASLYFFDAAALGPALVRDADEWPGERYRRDDPVLHIELRRCADVLLIAPLDANTLAKLALGLADNCLTCVYRAWDRTRPVVLAPAMNTLMWEHPATARHLRQVGEDLGGSLRVVEPVNKRLACDDVGVGAMAPRDAIIEAVRALMRAAE
jgi:phosphopantothenoylcysteine decarboxylase